MLSSNLLKSKIPIGGGGVAEFDAEFKFAKIQNSHLCVCGGGGGLQNLMPSSNLLKSKIPICVCVCVGGGLQNLMLSSDLLKSKIPICGGGGVFTEFDAEFRFPKVQNSHFWRRGVSQNLMERSDLLKSKIPICGGGGGGSRNLMLSSDLLKSKIPICVCVCVCVGGGLVEPISNF